MELPMFPLGAVVFPHMAVPLRVFEPRYQQLLDDVLSGDRTFGTVLIERGSEVGGGDVRFEMGATVRIASVERLPEADHRQVVGAGINRIRVREWLEEEPYPKGEVEFWPDDDQPVGEELIGSVDLALRRVLALASELGADVGALEFDLGTDPVAASYQAAALTPVTDLDRYELLCAAGPADRLERCRELLDESADYLSRRLST